VQICQIAPRPLTPGVKDPKNSPDEQKLNFD
jgi:hypothetical protein